MPGVPQQPQTPQMSRLIVAAPVSGRGPFRWNDDLDFLNCYVAQPLIAISGLPSVTTTPNKYYVAWTKAPGVKVLRITVEPNTAASGTRPSLTCAVTSSSGSVNWCEIGSQLRLDGSININATQSAFADVSQIVNHLDVSALTDGTTYDLIFTITDTSGTAGVSRGLYSIYVSEVALADTDAVGAPTTELGADSAWLQTTDRNYIVDGTTSLSYGMERVLNQLEYARYQHRRHIQIVRPENTTDAWNTNSTTLGNAWPFGFTAAPTFRVRGRALNGTATANTYGIRVRYNTSTTQKMWLRISTTAVGSGVTTNNDYKLNASNGGLGGGWTAATTDSTGTTLSVTIPCSGTGQETDITFGLWNDAAGTVYVSQLALIEAET